MSILKRSPAGVVKFFIALEWIDGVSVEEVITSRAPLGPDTAPCPGSSKQPKGAGHPYRQILSIGTVQPTNIMVTIHNIIKVIKNGPRPPACDR